MKRRIISIGGALLALLVVIGAARADDLMPVPVNITAAQIETRPDGTLILHVMGELGTGCESPIHADQRLEGSTLHVELYQTLPAAVICPMILVFYEDSIPLAADRSEVERVLVNGTPAIFGDAFTVDPPDDDAPISDELTHRVPHVITEIDGLWLEDGTWYLQVEGYQPDGCDYPLIINIDDDNDFWTAIELYREIPPDVRCPQVIIEFSEAIPLEAFGEYVQERWASGDEERVQWAFEVNDELARTIFDLPPADDTALEPVIEPAAREVSTVTGVQTQVEAEGVTLFVSGHHLTGCRYPTRIRQEIDGDMLIVEIYRAGPEEEEPCPRILLSFEEAIFFDAQLEPGAYRYAANEMTGQFTVREVRDDMRRSPHVIEDVQALVLESFPPQVILMASGYIPDGCTTDTHIDTHRDGNTVYVEIYRLLPVDAVCPAVIVDYRERIPLGSFSPGSYTFEVNGVRLDVDL
jgi:hypothetical protein